MNKELIKLLKLIIRFMKESGNMSGKTYLSVRRDIYDLAVKLLDEEETRDQEKSA